MNKCLALFIICTIFLLTNCGTEDDMEMMEDPMEDPIEESECITEIYQDTFGAVTRLLLLKINYLTAEFEGGHEFGISRFPCLADTIPLNITYESPGDLGHFSVYYGLNNDKKIIDATVWWLATGQILYPETFLPACAYEREENPIAVPDSTRFQNNNIDYFVISERHFDNEFYAKIWKSIEDLSIVKDYLSHNKKICLFIYPGTQGGGGLAGPDELYWNWFVTMLK